MAGPAYQKSVFINCPFDSAFDLSPYKSEGSENLARFNMPLELGMSLGIRYLRIIEYAASSKQHNWLALVLPRFVHQKFISDLNGFDSVVAHKGKPLQIVVGVAAWLKKQPDFKAPVPSADDIRREFPKFRRTLKEIEAKEGQLVWRDTIRPTKISNPPWK